MTVAELIAILKKQPSDKVISVWAAYNDELCREAHVSELEDTVYIGDSPM